MCDFQFYGNTFSRYIIALIAFLVSYGTIKLSRKIIIWQLKHIASKTKTDIDDYIIKLFEQLNWPFYMLVSVYISLKSLALTPNIDTALNYILLLTVTYYFVRTFSIVITFAANRVEKKREKEEKIHDAAVVHLIENVAKASLWIIAFVFILSNLGYNVSSLLAGFGIGGIAIALAMQNVLGDVFSSISIYFDKPFVVGDFIIVGKDIGTVKKIGIKTTRLETLQGEELVISNHELTASRIQNFKRMQRRRIVFTFGVEYDTPVSKLKKISEIVKGTIGNIKITELDRVHFFRFGESSLDFEVAYYIKSNEYNVYMDTQQQINLEIKEIFEKEKISMAYPTRTVYMHRA